MLDDQGPQEGPNYDRRRSVALSLAHALPSALARGVLDEPTYFEEDGRPIPFALVGGVAHSLLEMYPNASDRDSVVALLRVAEELLDQGDEEAIDIIATGLVEDVVNIWSHERVADLPSIVDLCGPKLAELFRSELLR